MRIPEASFDDLVQMGLEDLSVKDAVLVDRLIVPGYEEYLARISGYAEGRLNTFDLNEQLSEYFLNDPFARVLEEEYMKLAEGKYSVEFSSVIGYSHDEQVERDDAQQAHIDWAPRDSNNEAIPSVTSNLTLWTASGRDWRWGLSNQTAVDPEKRVFELPQTSVPLAVGGLVLLGESARVDHEGKPCTVLHEVVSPEASWSATEIQRIRVTQYVNAI
jgi:hypothetical protein